MSLTCAELRTRLAEAEAALHELTIGGKVVVVRMGEKQVEYSPAKAADLSQYVQSLQEAVDKCDGKRNAGRRALRFFAVDE